MRRLVLIIALIAGVLRLDAQEKDLDFLFYLASKGYHEEVVHLCQMDAAPELGSDALDSLRYIHGWSLYSLKRLGPSTASLAQVGPSSPFYPKARLFAAYNEVYLGEYSQARSLLSDMVHRDSVSASLGHFLKAGMFLLEGGMDDFDRQFGKVDTSFYGVQREAARMKQHALEMQDHRQRSPFVAGMMSAVVPGAGQVYARKPLQGLSAFITVAGLGMVTLENYRKLGPENIKTLAFGAAFSVFYIANIYGAVFSVRLAEQEFQDEYRNKILFDLHIPLRTVYN